MWYSGQVRGVHVATQSILYVEWLAQGNVETSTCLPDMSVMDNNKGPFIDYGYL